jgi:hypothetical protein
VNDLPPLPDGFVLDTPDPLKPLLDLGVDYSNGFRTEKDIEELKAQGYHPANNSLHLNGDAVDLLPGKSGLTLAQIKAKADEIAAQWPGGRALNEGDHIHLQLPKWGQAPGTPGSPHSGLPDLPPGFELEQRGSINRASIEGKDNNPGVVTGREFADSATYLPTGATDYADALHQAIASGAAKDHAGLIQIAKDWNTAHGTDFGLPMLDQGESEAFKTAAKGGKFGVAPPRMSAGQQQRMDERIAETKAGGSPAGASAVLGAEDTITRGAMDEAGALLDATGDVISGKPFDYTGNLNATRGYIDAVRGEHPNYYIGGQVGGAFIDPLMVNANGVFNMAKVGATEGGVYGFNEADGSLADRAVGMGIGAVGGAVAGPVIGKTLEGAGAVAARVFGNGERNAVEEAAIAPLEGEVVPEAVAQPEAVAAPQSAAMEVEQGPSVSGRVPDRIDVANAPSLAVPGTPEERAVAGAVTPEQVSAPPLSEVAKAGNINLSKIQTPEDIDALMKFTADTFGEFKGERRGVQSWDATAALAKDLGMTPDDLLARRTGEAFNAEQAHAARGILSASAAETRNLADAAINGSEADKAAFVKSFLLHAAITEKASGAAAEAGRALNIYRKVSEASLGDREAIQGAIKRLQEGATPEQLAEMVRQLGDDPTALNRFARDAVKPRFRDKVMFVWINALLSGPKTHIVNMSSNLLTQVMSIPEHVIAAGIGGARKAAGSDADAVLMSEIGPRFYGMIRGGAEGLSMAKEALAVAESGGKTDMIRPAIGGVAGKVISVPTRLLNAEDAFFKGMAKRSELAGLAMRKARVEGLKGEALKERVEHLLANPTDEMKTAAVDAALYNTFQRPLGPAGQKIAKALETNGWIKLFVPFVRTPTNLLKYAVERSPVAPILKEVRNDFAAGGAKRDLALARMTFGTGIGAVVAGLAAQGRITGNGPADPSAKKALQANGWQPYSFKIGDEYVSYRRLDPWATVIGMAADSVELQSTMTAKQQQDAGAVIIGAMVQNLSSKTWLSGLSDLVDAVTNPQQNAKATLTRLAASMATPTLAGQVAQAIDPVQRDTLGDGYIDTIRKKIEARIPGQSQNIIAKRDILGNEVRSESGFVGRLVSPFDVKSDKHDPIAQAIYDSGARFSVPSRSVGGGRLPDDAYDMYQQLAGQLFSNAMKDAMSSPTWNDLAKPDRAKLIEKTKNATRKEARSELFGL